MSLGVVVIEGRKWVDRIRDEASSSVSAECKKERDEEVMHVSKGFKDRWRVMSPCVHKKHMI
jgi:hypothetical protein